MTLQHALTASVAAAALLLASSITSQYATVDACIVVPVTVVDWWHEAIIGVYVGDMTLTQTNPCTVYLVSLLLTGKYFVYFCYL